MISQIRKCFITLSVQTQSELTQIHKPHLCYSISPLFFSSLSKTIEQIPVSDYLINQHHFSPDIAQKASSTIPFVKNPQNTDSVFKCLKESGFSKTRIETLINRNPRVLSINVTTIQPIIKTFRDSGFSPSDIADIMSDNPWFLKYTPDDRLQSTISALNNILGSTNLTCKILSKSGNWFIRRDMQLIANTEYLNKTCGISSDQIKSYLLWNPRVFIRKPESMIEVVRRVDETGLDRSSKLFMQAIRSMCSLTVKKWELKMQFFRELGLSEDEIWAVFRRAPQVFSLSVEKMKERIDILAGSGKFDMSLVVKYPPLLAYSVDHRIKPRLDIVEILEKKDLLKTSPKLVAILKLSSKKFLERYVLPFSDALGDDSIAKLRRRR